MISSCLYLLLDFEWLLTSKICLYQYQDTDTFVLRSSVRSNAELFF